MDSFLISFSDRIYRICRIVFFRKNVRLTKSADNIIFRINSILKGFSRTPGFISENFDPNVHNVREDN